MQTLNIEIINSLTGNREYLELTATKVSDLSMDFIFKAAINAVRDKHKMQDSIDAGFVNYMLVIRTPFNVHKKNEGEK